MQFFVEQAVLDAGVKILFPVVEGMDNTRRSAEWDAYRAEKLEELYRRYEGLDVHADPILEGFHLLHDAVGVKRRKNIPASENLIRLLLKHHDMFYINQAVDIYNLISMDSRLALGAHDIDRAEGNITLRFTDGSEKYVPLGQSEPVPVNPHEYCYCDDANEVLCRCEIRQVNKTAVTEQAKNVFYIVQGNAATPDALLRQVAETLVADTRKYCGGAGRIVAPTVI